MLSLGRWLREYFNYFILRRIQVPLSQKFPLMKKFFDKYLIRNNVKKDLLFIKKYHKDKRKIVFFGLNDITKLYIKNIERIYPELLYGIIFYPEQPEPIDPKYKKYVKNLDELFYEDLDTFLLYAANNWEEIKIAGMLIENNVNRADIFHNGRTELLGGSTKKVEAYDPIIGYSRNEKDTPGFVVFANVNDEKDKNIFKIITLGGSTSDPYLSNIKSWSELLFEMLNNLNIPVKIYAGGVSGYTASQEALKLIRDGITLKPDLVLSYSGVNDVQSKLYDVEKHFFVRSYMPNIFKTLIKHRKIKNELQGDFVLTELNLGVENWENKAEFWIRCERTMHAVCEEFDIKFHAFLQPRFIRKYVLMYSLFDPKIIASDLFFDTVSTYIARGRGQLWLHDFTNIFNGSDELFYDFCHVYEKGNRIIAQKILPYVLEAIKIKEQNKEK